MFTGEVNNIALSANIDQRIQSRKKRNECIEKKRMHTEQEKT